MNFQTTLAGAVFTRPLALASLPLLLCGSLFGCSSDAYDEQMKATYEKYKPLSLSLVSDEDLRGADRIELEGSVVSVPIPNFMSSYVLTETPPTAGGEGFNMHRIFPAGVRLPGYQKTYEDRARASDHSEWPYYYYIGVLQVEPDSLATYQAAIREKLAAQLANVPETWEQLPPIKNANNEEMIWYRLPVEGEFFTEEFGGAKLDAWSKFPSVLELYMTEYKGHLITLGWKAPLPFVPTTAIPPGEAPQKNKSPAQQRAEEVITKPKLLKDLFQEGILLENVKVQ